MGVVRLLLWVVCLGIVSEGRSQYTISEIKVSATWNQREGRVLVTEKIRFDPTGSSEKIRLQSLPIGAVITGLKLFVNGTLTDLETSQDHNGLKEIELMPNEAGILHLKYEVEVNEHMLIVPLIFPRMNNIPSNENLFSASISIPNNYRIVNSFPTVEAEAKPEGNQIVYDVTLPVIPSMLRVEVSKNGEVSLSTIDLLDGAVLVVLAIVGVAGWRKRKMLI
ncbi:MAG: hypothetical protein RIB47_01075 [Cyclobacteriaceae bacterium]